MVDGLQAELAQRGDVEPFGFGVGFEGEALGFRPPGRFVVLVGRDAHHLRHRDRRLDLAEAVEARPKADDVRAIGARIGVVAPLPRVEVDAERSEVFVVARRIEARSFPSRLPPGSHSGTRRAMCWRGVVRRAKSTERLQLPLLASAVLILSLNCKSAFLVANIDSWRGISIWGEFGFGVRMHPIKAHCTLRDCMAAFPYHRTGSTHSTSQPISAWRRSRCFHAEPVVSRSIRGGSNALTPLRLREGCNDRTDENESQPQNENCWLGVEWLDIWQYLSEALRCSQQRGLFALLELAERSALAVRPRARTAARGRGATSGASDCGNSRKCSR